MAARIDVETLTADHLMERPCEVGPHGNNSGAAIPYSLTGK